MMLGTLKRTLGLAIRQAQPQLLSGGRSSQLPWRHEMQTRASAARSVTFQSLEDCLMLNYGGTRVHLNYVWLRDHCRSASEYNSKTNQRNLDTGSIDLTIRPANTTVQDGHLVLKLLNYGGTRMHLNYVWLRDHCRSASEYNPKTNQRNLDTGSIDLNIRPANTTVQDGHLVLTWPGGHVSQYSLSWLAENSYEGQKQNTIQPRVLWNSDIYKNANIPSAKWDIFMSCDVEVKKFLQNYLLYGGVAFVDDVPATVEATEAVTQRVGLIRETTYGRIWTLTSDFARGDEALSLVALDRHTDTSYLQEPCGIQVLHCLKHEGTGGRTLFVDGFYAAEKVRQQSPENFELLASVPIRHEFIENLDNHQNHLIGVSPVLNVYPWNNEMYLIRYNNYKQSVINTMPHHLIQRWYVAHRELTTELRRPENELWVKLSPGKVIFIDNQRVLHGREAYTGLRQLCGCYLTRDDVLSSARSFGLQA